ncbi:DNA ligase D [Schlesneria sp. DSM 10557]|uniref:DNA ligase D n=1 Tax=Schlesneria sp. DSM 10557 TaxID=3044399 RepID=UPI0035A015A8
MGLTDYQRKRRFDKTPEPPAQTKARKGWSYVVQKHDASHLHYDFRLELDGVLKSWAVPKGPSLDTKVKRLAIEVEDHPVDYGTFEGTIPEGEYGGGTVLLWDTGSWEPIGDPESGLREGKLKFNLKGKKLKGGWTLVRTRRKGSSSQKPQWLLIKERDAQARSMDDGDILEEQPLSVSSKRDLDTIAADADAGKKKQTTKTADIPKSRTRSSSSSKPSKSKRTQASSIPEPDKISVQLATLVDEAPEGDEWCHEIKFDGYRIICHIDDGTSRFVTRNHKDWTARLPELARQAAHLKCDQAILDGEVVAMSSDGTTDFQSLQNAFRDRGTEQLRYYVFDLLYLDGKDLREQPLQERKQALQTLLESTSNHRSIQYSEPIMGRGDVFLKQACKLHLEGIICKRLDQPYRPGRGTDWLKVKCLKHEEFVIGGFTDPSGSRTGFGALLVGFYDDEQKLHYAGKVGTGFDAKLLKELHANMKELEVSDSPFVDLQRKVGDARTAHWIQPKLVGQIKFADKTRDMRLRHASFQGLREDKPPRDVGQEVPAKLEEVLTNPVPRKASPKKEPARPAAATQKTSRSKRAQNSKGAPAEGNSDYDPQSEMFAGVRFTHPEKIVYPEAELTKLDIARYYQEVAEWILPHVVHRPIVVVRCPDGAGKQCFYQKHPQPGAPENLRQIPIKESTATKNYVVVDDVEGLLSLVQMGSLEIHTWGSTEDHLERPDRLIFDLDPDENVSWAKVVESARQIHDFLHELGLASFIKTTGGKGLHIVLPIERRHEWDDAKEFCKHVADAIVAAAPARFTSNMSKAARKNKIFIDYLRNARGATAVAPYSTRAKANAFVSMPLEWEEVSTKITSDYFTIETALQRLATLKRDPWREISKVRQSLSAPSKKLDKVLRN